MKIASTVTAVSQFRMRLFLPAARSVIAVKPSGWRTAPRYWVRKINSCTALMCIIVRRFLAEIIDWCRAASRCSARPSVRLRQDNTVAGGRMAVHALTAFIWGGNAGPEQTTVPIYDELNATSKPFEACSFCSRSNVKSTIGADHRNAYA